MRTHLGEVWSDWGWPEFRVLVEYDGRVKYGDQSALMAEKRRHDALVETGHRVARVVKEDLAGSRLPDRLLSLLPSALTLAPRPELGWRPPTW